MRAVVWKRQAIYDLTRIGLHIAKDSAANAGKMIDRIADKVVALATYPELGRIGRQLDTYDLVVHEHYVVIYRVLANRIEILRVKHTAQRWPPSRS